MESSRIVFVINDTVRAIKGRYEESGTEAIFKTFDATIAVDDLVVVQASTRWGMTVFKVTAVDLDVDFDSSSPILWAVQKIDKPAFDTILAQEKDAISTVQQAELRRRKEALRAQMFKDHEDSMSTLALANHAEAAVTE